PRFPIPLHTLKELAAPTRLRALVAQVRRIGDGFHRAVKVGNTFFIGIERCHLVFCRALRVMASNLFATRLFDDTELVALFLDLVRHVYPPNLFWNSRSMFATMFLPSSLSTCWSVFQPVAV